MPVVVYRCVAALLGVVLVLAASLLIAPSTRASLGAQDDNNTPQELTVELTDEQADGTWTGTAELGAGVNIVGATWTSANDAPGTARFRTGTDGAWSPWQDMAVSATEVSTGTEGDLVMGPLELEIEVTAAASAVTLTVWSVPAEGGDSDAVKRRVDGSSLSSKYGGTEATRQAASGASPGLVIGTRAQWGADESLRKWSPNYIDDTEGVTIHHTAGTNNYSASQVPAILRGIYQYHAVTRDWGDVGYNLFVDKYGRAWEGRRGGPEASLRTAHALGMNYSTAGIALIGDYNTASVPRAAFDGLARVTAWKLITHGVNRSSSFDHENDAEGWMRTLPAVHGHRDVNQTSCPGDRFYARIGEFRSKVRSYGRDAVAMQRVSGPDRYATAAELASAAHPFGADTVYITRGVDIIEALTVGASAAHEDDALLLTKSSSLPPVTAAQIRKLDPKEVVVVAEPSRISPAVLKQIREATDAPVRQITPADQYELAAGLSRAWSQSPVVYVASGQEPADALSGGAAAAHDDAPLLLSTSGNMPATTQQELARLQPQEVVILGGTSRIPSRAKDDVLRNVPGATVTRIAGSNRYSTSALVSGERFDRSSRAFLANGSASIDAIAGTQYAAASDSPVLLSRRSCRSAEVANTMDDLGTDLHVLLGGPVQLDDASATGVCR
ncbi:MAG: cell wall-binding repeat-containing protein [Ornithinimicrobium sp.]